jgi:hypothetical protein
MHGRQLVSIVLLGFFVPALSFAADAPIRVACVGDSITHGWTIPIFFPTGCIPTPTAPPSLPGRWGQL